MEEEINLYDYWIILRKNKWLIIGFFFFFVISSMFISLKMPKVYKATATILPLTSSSEPSFKTQLAESFGISIGKGDQSGMFLAILNSRTMKDAVIEKFNLKQIYNCKTMQSARANLGKNTKINKTKENTIEINVLDTNPERASHIANFYVEHLDYLLKNLDISQASYKRKFIEERLKETEMELKKAEENLKNYQMKNKILLDNQASIGTAVGELQGKLIASKIKLETIKKFTTEQNPEVIKLENEIKETEAQVAKLPPIETTLGRIIRDLKVQETVYQLLRGEYESARIDEAKDTPRIQILDYAVVPEKKYKPSIKQNMVLSGIIGLFIGTFLSFFLEYLKKLPKPEKEI